MQVQVHSLSTAARPRNRGAIGARLCGLALALAALGACERTRGGANRQPGDMLVFEQGKGDARDVFVVAADGGEPRRLTDDPAAEGLPRWTADGDAVLFSSKRSGNWQLWRVPLAGGGPTRLRSNPHTEWQADVSPDGRRLAFLSDAEGPEFLWLAEGASGDARALVRHSRRATLGNPDWSPDGRQIVFSSNWRDGHQIYVVDVEGGRERRISPKGGCEPRWSPDGRRVTYVGRRPVQDRSEILEHDLPSGQERVLVAWPALNYDPVYSPDGSEIAFASTITGGWEVYRLRLADGKAWRVTFGGLDARYPDYRPHPPR